MKSCLKPRLGRHISTRSRKKYWALVVLVAIVLSTTIIVSNRVFAAVKVFDDEKEQAALIGDRSKFLYTALNQCYSRMRSPITAKITMGWSDIFQNDSDSIKIPSSIYPDLHDSTLKCRELMGGWHGFAGWGGNFNGVAEKPGAVPLSQNGTASKSAVIDFLNQIGYETDKNSDSNLFGYSCIYFYKPGVYTTDKICVKVKDDGKTVDTTAPIKIEQTPYINEAVNENTTIYWWKFSQANSVYYSAENKEFAIAKIGGERLNNGYLWNTQNAPCRAPSNHDKADLGEFKSCYTWTNLVTGAQDHLKVQNIEPDGLTVDLIKLIMLTALNTINYEIDAFQPSDGKIVPPEQPQLRKKKDGVKDFMTYFIGKDYEKYSGDLTPAGLYTLYHHDLEHLGVSVRCGFDKPFESTSDIFDIKYWRQDSGEMATDCVAYDKPGKVTTAWRPNPSSLQELNVKEIVYKMNALDYDDESFSIIDQTGDAYENLPGDTDTNGSGTDNRCFAAAASLGWIVCPVIQAVGNAVEGIYDNVVAPFLTIDAQYFSTAGSRNGVYNGWNIFREFSNIVFVILFVVVILAQITGIGISNYNIKKVLPRLIVIVVLVNMSFIICQLAVDLSNILGYQLNNLFANQLASSITIDPIGGEDVSYTLGGIVSVITTVLAGGAGYLAVVNWQLWIIPLLLALLSCGIGILFFFVILGVRQAGVIVLAVLAPLAIVCYALPNTKSLFDKWRKLFTSLLVLYPLCGILMGGGAFASKLLIAVNGGENFFYTLVAMLLTVVPFFFIPTLLKSSMAAIGNIGTKLSSIGKSWGSAASRGISNTDTVGDWKRQLEKRHNLSIANRLDRRLARRRSSDPNATLSAGSMRRLARAKVAYQSAMLDEGNNQFVAESMTPESIQQALDAQKLDQEQKLINNAAQSIIGGNASYIDAAGVQHEINAGDLSTPRSTNSLLAAFKALSAEYDRTGNRQIGTKMNAVAQVMMNKYKDKGVSAILGELGGNLDNSGHVARTKTLNSVSQLMNRDEKVMGKLKEGNYGGYQLITDGANFVGNAVSPSVAAPMGSQLDYLVPDASHTTTANIPHLSDSLFDGFEEAKNQGVFQVGGGKYNQKKADELIKLADTIRRAVGDDKIAKDIKPSDLTKLNNVTAQAYVIERDRWLAQNPGKTNADYNKTIPYQRLKFK